MFSVFCSQNLKLIWVRACGRNSECSYLPFVILASLSIDKNVTVLRLPTFHILKLHFLLIKSLPQCLVGKMVDVWIGCNFSPVFFLSFFNFALEITLAIILDSVSLWLFCGKHLYEGCTESNASYLLAHNTRDLHWWYGSSGWTSHP